MNKKRIFLNQKENKRIQKNKRCKKDYCKPKKTNDSLNNNYIEHESKGDKDETFSIKEYLDIIRPYLSDIIYDYKTQGQWEVYSGNTVIYYKTQGKWKIQLTMAINFISFKDSNETRTMHTKSNNMEIMIGSETYEIIRELFESLFAKISESMRGSEFVFDSFNLLC